jgi:cobalt-zinc-cadmium efflux system outer membrane protein
MSLRHPVVFLVLVTLAALSARAEEPLTVDAAINHALTHNRDLATFRFGAEAARGRVDQAGLKPNPSLEAGAQTDLITGNTGARKFDLGITQAIPLGNRLRELQSLARVGIPAAEAELANRQRLLVGDVTLAFVDLLTFDRQIALRDRLVETNRRLVELARARSKLGEVSAVEVNAAALEQAKLEQERATLLAERINRLQQVKPLLGLTPEEPLEITGDLDAMLPALASGAEGGKSTWNRPDLRRASLALERLDAEQRVAHAEVRGDVTVGATYGFERGPSGDADHLLGVKMSIPLPVRNKNQGRLRELRAERARAQREVEALELAIASEVAVARQRAAQFQKIAADYRTAVLPLGATAERDLAAGYQQGQVPLFQVIQSQQQRLALEAGALEATSAYARALVDLQTATGKNPQLANASAPEVQP